MSNNGLYSSLLKITCLFVFCLGNYGPIQSSSISFITNVSVASIGFVNLKRDLPPISIATAYWLMINSVKQLHFAAKNNYEDD